MERKALERLVEALIDPKHENNRVEAIENAISMAQIALWGELELDSDELIKNLDDLGLHLTLARLEREDKDCLHLTTGSSEAKVLATTSPVVAGILDHTLKQCFPEPTQYDVN